MDMVNTIDINGTACMEMHRIWSSHRCTLVYKALLLTLTPPEPYTLYEHNCFSKLAELLF